MPMLLIISQLSLTLMSTIGYEDQDTFRSLAELKTHLFWILAKALAKESVETQQQQGPYQSKDSIWLSAFLRLSPG